MITFHAPQKGPTFLQDEVGGVETVPPANATNLFVGAGVTLQGYAEPSGLSPRIVVEELRITGTNSLPIPKPGHAGAMMVGQSDGSYIFAEGINRRAKPVGYEHADQVESLRTRFSGAAARRCRAESGGLCRCTGAD